MSEAQISAVNPNQVIRANKIEIKQEDKDILIAAVGRALQAKKPSAEDLKLVKKC